MRPTMLFATQGAQFTIETSTRRPLAVEVGEDGRSRRGIFTPSTIGAKPFLVIPTDASPTSRTTAHAVSPYHPGNSAVTFPDL